MPQNIQMCLSNRRRYGQGLALPPTHPDQASTRMRQAMWCVEQTVRIPRPAAWQTDPRATGPSVDPVLVRTSKPRHPTRRIFSPAATEGLLNHRFWRQTPARRPIRIQVTDKSGYEQSAHAHVHALRSYLYSRLKTLSSFVDRPLHQLLGLAQEAAHVSDRNRVGLCTLHRSVPQPQVRGRFARSHSRRPGRRRSYRHNKRTDVPIAGVPARL